MINFPMPDSIDVWQVPLQQPAAVVRRLAAVLDRDEAARADRFYAVRHREAFIVAHGVLRTLLGGYLGTDPQCVKFETGAGGKPVLSGSREWRSLRFNMSHCDDLALYAFAVGHEVGVDVENLREVPDADHVAQNFFSARENAELRALPANRKSAGFLACWTRKEAYLKAVGVGLAAPLDQFDVSLTPGEPAMLLHVANDPQEADRWCLRELKPSPEHIAALAVEGCAYNIQTRQWHNEITRNGATRAIARG